MEAEAFGVVEGVVRFDEGVFRSCCEIDEARQAQTRQQSSLQLKTASKPITLEFREAPLRSVFETPLLWQLAERLDVLAAEPTSALTLWSRLSIRMNSRRRSET